MRFSACFLSIAAVALLGCNKGPIPIETAPVNGTATFNGKPLKDYRVSFYLMGHPAQEPSIGRVDADGHFTLSTREKNDGAIIGKNQIWLTYDPEMPEEVPGMETGTPPPPPTVKVPEKFLDRDTSGLTVDVPAQGLKDYKLELKE